MTATITYCLSEEAREREVKAGRSGAYHRNVSGAIAEEDARLFQAAVDGYPSAMFPVREFDAPKSFDTLLAHLRARRQRLSAIRRAFETAFARN